MNDLLPLIMQSVQLMFIGMGTVFLILILLIYLINLVSKLLTKLGLEDAPKTTRPACRVAKMPAGSPDNELIAVISSAVNRYRKRHSVN